MNSETPVYRPDTVAPNLPELKLRDAWHGPWRGGLRAAYASVTGSSHARNEDCCSHVPSAERPDFVGVADGVGGGAHGEIASSVLLRHCAQAPKAVWSDPAKLVQWLSRADGEVSGTFNPTHTTGTDPCGSTSSDGAIAGGGAGCNVAPPGVGTAVGLGPGLLAGGLAFFGAYRRRNRRQR